jgi:prophage tail gpP-like protein
MPNPALICIVTAGGTKYQNWKTVEVSRCVEDEFIDHAMLTVAEIKGGNPSGLSNLKLKPFDKVTITLAGQPALEGFVYLRQGIVDATSHQVQIGICSNNQAVMVSTVDAKPGQYTDQTLEQIAKAAFAPVKVNFRIVGNPDGADKKFEKVSEQVGETRVAFVTRLAQMRNIHLASDPDDSHGIIGFRGPQAGGQTVKEGQNLLRGRLMLQVWDHSDEIQYIGQQTNKDSGDQNRQSHGEAKIGGPKRPQRYAAGEAGDNQQMKMAAQQDADRIQYTMVDGDVTVPGWLCPDGSLWMRHLREKMTLTAPTLLPQDTMHFFIKGVTHRQSEAGTVTDILLTDEKGLGTSNESLQTDGEASALVEGTAPL